jgi:hypothetical protein
MSSLALADVFIGAGSVFAGFYRSYLILQQVFLIYKNAITTIQVDAIPDRTPWQCMMVVHNFFFIFGQPASGILLTTVNIDRFIAVAWPIVRRLH